MYGFDRWHVGHAGEQYAADIVYLERVARRPIARPVVEIGCGLGDILAICAFIRASAWTATPAPSAAARFLARFQAGEPPRFEVFEFPRGQLTGVYNAIIMVNWIHQS